MAITTIGADAATSLGTTITANAVQHVKGSYTQMTASTAADCDGFVAWLRGTVFSNNYLVDIATGAGGSETVVIANVPSNWGGGQFTPVLNAPLAISSGTRIA